MCYRFVTCLLIACCYLTGWAGELDASSDLDQFELSDPPKVVFYVPFENSSDGLGRKFTYPDIFRLSGITPIHTPLQYDKGIVGQGAYFPFVPATGHSGVQYPINDIFPGEKGTASVWIKQDADSMSLVMPGSSADSVACLTLWQLRFKKIVGDGKWHHLVYTWNVKQGEKRQYVDGVLVNKQPYKEPFEGPRFVFGMQLKNRLDELVILDQPFDKKEVVALYRAYRSGKEPFESLPAGGPRYYPLDLSGSNLSRPDHPQWVQWDLNQPTFDNGYRTQYQLDGFWRFQPMPIGARTVDPNAWYYAPVPGNWVGQRSKPVLNTHKESVSTLNDRAFAKHGAIVLERDIVLPSEALGQQVLLFLEQINADFSFYPTTIYVNQNEVGEILFLDRNYYDLTPHIKFGESNCITLIHGYPNDSLWDVAIHKAPILELRKSPNISLDEPLIVPSVRRKSLTLELPVSNRDATPANLLARATVFDQKLERIVETTGSRPLQLEAGFDGYREVELPVTKLAYWSPASPVLYNLVVELLDPRTNKVVDKTPPVRFGYREVWTEGGDVILNGERISIRGGSHNLLYHSPFIASEMRLQKELGISADRTTYPYRADIIDSLHVADEHGWLVTYQVSGVYPDWPNVSVDWFRRILRMVGNHPSVIAWQLWTPGHYYNGPHGHPMQIGGTVPDEVKQTEPAYRRSGFLSQIDPTHRPTFYYVSGTGGDIRGIMTSMSYGMPIQEMEEWISDWAKNKPQPFIPTEQQIFSRPDYFFQRGSDESVVAEHYARYFGERAYEQMTGELVDSWQKIRHKWATRPYWMDMYNMAYERVLRSWRTYGISGYLFHASFHMQNLFEGGRKGGPLTPFGKAIKRVNAPVIAYVGGPRENFVEKGHNYFAGEAVQKSAIVINDSFADIPGTLLWSVTDASGKVIARKRVTQTVKRNEVLFHPIHFDAPNVTAKSEFTISMSFEGQGIEPLNESLVLSIFPEPHKPVVNGRVVLIDQTGETKRVLELAGVQYEALENKTQAMLLDKARLLIVGKNSYAKMVDLASQGLDFDAAIDRGMNLIVLEQMHRNVAGLTVENFKSRRVFVCDQDAELLAGFSHDDFTDWRGESRMLKPYQSWNPRSNWQEYFASKHGQKNAFNQGRFWHWTNKGMVATFCYQKPQRGNYRVLLHNGFDLLFTPLVEYRVGRGRALFSSLDLIDHYGREPVATILLHRMIQQYSDKPNPSAAVNVFAFDEFATKLSESIGFTTQTDLAKCDVAVASLSRDTDEQQLQSLLDRGGTAVVLIPEQSLVKKLPIEATVEDGEYFNSRVPDHALFAGLSMSDLYYRKVTTLPLVQQSADDRANSPVIGVLPGGKGRIVYIQLDPDDFEDPWQRTKVLRIYATVLSNLKASFAARPNFSLIGGYGSENEWLPGYFVDVPNLEKAPKVEESPVYAVPALDFDPNAHYVW